VTTTTGYLPAVDAALHETSGVAGGFKLNLGCAALRRKRSYESVTGCLPACPSGRHGAVPPEVAGVLEAVRHSRVAPPTATVAAGRASAPPLPPNVVSTPTLSCSLMSLIGQRRRDAVSRGRNSDRVARARATRGVTVSHQSVTGCDGAYGDPFLPGNIGVWHARSGSGTRGRGGR
jgi:hypothetical protein